MAPTSTPPTDYPALGFLIDGEWQRPAPGGKTVSVINPADESVIGQLPVATPADLDRALAAAARGFALWRQSAPTARAAVLNKAAALLRERAPTIGRHISLEQGKTVAEGVSETMRAADILEWDAGEAQRIYGRVLPAAPGWRPMVLRQPIGPVAAFTPWNAPVNTPSRKVSAAVAAGCSLIVKAAEETPAGMIHLAQCLMDAGLPAGVLNVVFGNPAEISQHLIASPIVRLVTFTGSVGVGKQLTALAGAHMKPVIMELGGHAPVIVCEDTDPVRAAEVAAASKFRMAGQVCVSPTRFIVHERIYDAFVTAFARATAALRVGPGSEAGVHMGALANQRRLEAISGLVEDARQRGARVAAGGHRVGDKGFFYAPTVLADVPLDAQAMSVEPFGPLALCTKFSSLDQAIALANQLSVGLAAYAFTESLPTAERLAEELETGLLSINHLGSAAPDMPFGGVKDSGIGREGGAESLEGYTVVKMVSMKTTVQG